MAKYDRDWFANSIKKIAEKKLEEARRHVEVQLDSAITLDKRHCSLVRHCKSLLINLYENTPIGYDIIMREPLIDLSLKKNDISVFDLVAINSTNGIASLIECKTGHNSKYMLKSFAKKIVSFNEHCSHIEKMLGINIKDSEFILCVESINTGGVLQSVNDHTNKKRRGQSSAFNELSEDKINRIIIWSVLEGENKIVKVYGNHLDTNFDRIMRGPPLFDYLSDLDLEYCSQPWRFIERVIYERIFVEKKRLDEANPKEFTYIEVVNALVDEFSDLAVDNLTLRSIAEQKASEIINHGIEYGIFEEVKKNRYCIKCRGERISTVRENLERKYSNNYINKEAERKAYEEAKKEVKRMHGDLSKFGIT